MTELNICPACVRLNVPDAVICSRCGAMLSAFTRPSEEAASEAFVDLSSMELDTDTTPAVHLDAPELQRWFDSRSGVVESQTPLPTLTLRTVDHLPPSDPDPTTADTLPPGLIPSDPEPAPRYVAAERASAAKTAPKTAPPPPPAAASRTPRTGRGASAAATSAVADTPAARAATKAKRRAQVRRSVLADNPAPAVPLALPTDVLVLDADEPSREQLCALLEAFGFRAHPVQSAIQAVRMLDAKRFAAAFLNVVFDGSVAPTSHDLCARVKAPPPHPSDPACALIVVTASSKPVERVRAALAGSDAFLQKPVNRGKVAQVLEACGVAMPADLRRV